MWSRRALMRFILLIELGEISTEGPVPEFEPKRKPQLTTIAELYQMILDPASSLANTSITTSSRSHHKSVTSPSIRHTLVYNFEELEHRIRPDPSRCLADLLPLMAPVLLAVLVLFTTLIPGTIDLLEGQEEGISG